MDLLRDVSLMLLREWEMSYTPEEVRTDIDKLKIMTAIRNSQVAVPDELKLFYEKVFLRNVFTSEQERPGE